MKPRQINGCFICLVISSFGLMKLHAKDIYSHPPGQLHCEAGNTQLCSPANTFAPSLPKNMDRLPNTNKSHLYTLASLENITRAELERFNPSPERNFINEMGFKTIRDALSQDTPYLIEPKTHRIWLTSSESPREVKPDRLAFYEKSLALYADTSFEHHFWCNDLSLIPQTVSALQSFTTPIILHEISEISQNFIAKKLYKKFLNDRLFAFAGEIARQEILLQEGGLYTDIGIEKISNLDPYFRHYDLLMCISFSWVDNHFLAAKKGSPFLAKSLSLIDRLPSTLATHAITPESKSIHWLLTVDTWQLVAAITNHTFGPEAFLYEGIDYRVHGLGTWYSDEEKLTVDYLNAD